MTEQDFRPGLEDVPAAKSAVSFIDGKRARLEYRGIPVETLAKESCFEETAWLLMKGSLPTQKQLADFDAERKFALAPRPAAEPPVVPRRASRSLRPGHPDEASRTGTRLGPQHPGGPSNTPGIRVPQLAQRPSPVSR